MNIVNAKLLQGFLIFSFTLIGSCKLQMNHLNEPGSKTFLTMQFLFCLTGVDSSFCPRIPVSGKITTKDTKIAIPNTTIFISKGNSSTPVSFQTNYSGLFSGFSNAVIFNVTIKSFANSVLGTFNVEMGGITGIKISNISNGLYVNAVQNANGIYFSLQIDEKSFFTFLGSAGAEAPFKIIQTSDGGFFLAGSGDTNIPNIGNLSPVYPNTSGDNDCLAAKFNSSGELSWYSFYGSTGNENCFGAVEAEDDGFVVTGTSASGFSNLGGVAPLKSFTGTSSFDAVILKLKSNGTINWYTFLGGGPGPNLVQLFDLIHASDGSGYIAGGSANSPIITNLTPINPKSTGHDQTILKINEDGSIAWITYLGGIGSELVYSISKATNGDYLAIGPTNNSINSIAGLSPRNPFNSTQDQLISRIDKNGNLKWFTFLGSSGTDEGNGIIGTSDGGALTIGKFVASVTLQGKNPISAYSGSAGDCSVIKLNSSGDVEWFTFIGTAAATTACVSGIEVAENEFVVYGETTTNINTLNGKTPQYSFSGGGFDLLLAKLNHLGEVQWYEMLGGTGDDRPRNMNSTADGGFIMSSTSTAGFTSFGGKTPVNLFTGGTDSLIMKVKADGKF